MSRPAIGARFGMWTVLALSVKPHPKHAWDRVKCDCGQERVVRRDTMKNGTSTNCGCKFTTHGMSETRTYNIWLHIKGRCNRKTNHAYSEYGGRGIKICERWMAFENFLADMGEVPEGHSIDRIDNDGNYEPGNCRWATPPEQASNRRSTIKVTIDGVTKPLTYWAKELGVHPGTATGRYQQTGDAMFALGLEKKVS